ncbi:GntR family transcriptional regulator [Labrys wisconsinensis]|uniref:DNA-binding GntR family transcriptional regulator n=1 Tax=Labrys wisconsinensis TaxID=425677 RepID=A0ABU0J919_9HYPH|nr:GntR family transcriptional regulator [Labrys wisconsinensis]MDQ0470767.1 DNA-binding GntR family transcriptional regulator [Labrys wisconsinensis]
MFDPDPDTEIVRLPALLGQELVGTLEREIVRLRLAPGTKLVEEDICQRFGVSRSPVREALQILASYGLVERRPRRGMVVTELSVTKLDEIYACRAVLEALAAAGVARRATPAIVATLEQRLAEMVRADQDDRRDDAFAANVALTDILHAECGNETLRQILVTLDKQALRYRFYCYRESREIVLTSLEANTAMVAAIKAGAPEQAGAVTQDLVTRSWQLIRAAITRELDDTSRRPRS